MSRIPLLQTVHGAHTVTERGHQRDGATQGGRGTTQISDERSATVHAGGTDDLLLEPRRIDSHLVIQEVLGRAGASARRVGEAARHQVDGVYARLLKPAFDRTFAALAIIVAIPAFLVVALVVRLSFGPGVLYRQCRVGRSGKPFTVFKFRTMEHDRRRPEPVGSFDGVDRRRTHKSHEDPRHRPVGRLLRKWSLDELPQLFNVLRGEMSVVGPRPELPSVVATYRGWEHERHLVRPGLTGLWQVQARGDGTLMREHIDLDVAYVRHVSAWTDLRILVRTLPALLGRHQGE
jgi:lipopolysaccharide/colanic/teichoic acid biosynthesis glycosyltransferase